MTDITIKIPAREKRGVKVAAVKKDEVWQFEAEGEWRDWYVRCGPDGYRSFLFHVLDIWPRAQHEPYFCIVGQVDAKGSSPFRIGSGVVKKMDSDGDLMVFANDHDIAYWNNSGEVTVRARLLKDKPHQPTPTTLKGWPLVRQVLDRTKGVGFVLALVIGACLALVLTPQGRDLVRTVGEDKIAGPHQILFGLMLLFLAMQAWFWPRVIINFHYGPKREDWRPAGFLNWMPRILGVAPFILTFLAMVRNPSSNVMGSVAILVLGLAFFVFVLVRQDLQDPPKWLRAIVHKAIPKRMESRPPPKPVRVGRLWVVFGLGLAAATMVLFCVDPVTVPRMLGPPAVVFLGVGLLIPPLVILIQSGASIRFPALGALLLAAVVFSSWLDNHQVGRRATHGVMQASIERPSLDEAYETWKSQFAAGKSQVNAGKPLSIVLVADEGGASRAGFWSGEVLAALEAKSGGEFSKHLFAINSISGGSVGAVGFAAALNEMPDKATPRTADDYLRMEQRIQRFTGADALSPVTAAMLFPDLLQRFVPFNLPTPDRAEALERSWEVAWASDCPAGKACKPELIRAPFLDLWRNTQRRWTPLVIVNGASEETGRRILTSPVVLLLKETGLSSDGHIDADDFHTITGTDAPASTVIHNGARFPYVSPAGTLRAEAGRAQHIVDGGYFDGAGIESTRQLAISLSQMAHKAGDKLTVTIIFIGYKVPEAEAKPPQRQTGNELLAPLIGMVGSRSAHQTHLWRQLYGTTSWTEKEDEVPQRGWVRLNQILLREVPECQANKPGLFQDDFIMPMDWALSERAKREMRWHVGFATLPHATTPACRDDQALIAAVLAAMLKPETGEPLVWPSDVTGPAAGAPATPAPARVTKAARAQQGN